MSLSPKTVQVCTEVDTLLGLVVIAVTDVKAGKPVSQVLIDLEAPFVSALTNIGQLKTEISDRADLERTGALKVCDLVDAVIPPA